MHPLFLCVERSVRSARCAVCCHGDTPMQRRAMGARERVVTSARLRTDALVRRGEDGGKTTAQG